MPKITCCTRIQQ